MSERRFTDREVGRILQRATELDKDDEGRPGGRGLTLAQLQDVGTEAGIPADLVARAAAEVGRPAALRPAALLGPPPVSREARSVPTVLPRDALGALVRAVDERVPAQGTAVEALGTVRWSSQGRLLSRQVTLDPGESDTLVRVEERFAPQVPLLLQGIPVVYGATAAAVLLSEGVGGAFGIVGAVFLVLVAWMLGRGAWEVLSRGSAKRVHALADVLAEEAGRLGGATGDEDPGDAQPIA